MPTVPFTPKSPSAPKIDETFAAMAAADLHSAGMLFEPMKAAPDEGRYHDEEDVDETNRKVKLPPEPEPDPETPPTRMIG